MGLFSSAPEVDPGLAPLIIGEEGTSRRAIEKAVAKNQSGLPSLLGDGEEIRAISRGDGINVILVVTDRRLLRVKKGKMDWAPIPLGEVAGTKLLSRDLGSGRVKYMVVIDTFESKQYSDADQRRYEPDHFINIDFDEQQEARAVCAVIDLML